MPSYLSPGVYVEEVPAGTRPIEGVGTAIAGFVGFAAQGPINEPVLVTNWTQFVENFGEMVENFALGKAVYGFFNNGGGRAYIVRIPTSARPSSAPMGELPSKADKKIAALNVMAISSRAKNVAVDVKAAGETDDQPTYKITITADGAKEETFTGTLASGPNNLATQVNTRSKIVRIQPNAVDEALIASGLQEGTVALAGADKAAPAKVETGELIGDPAKRTGFTAFETLEQITMIAAPDVAVAQANGLIDLDAMKAIQAGMLAHCELMGNRMAILDTPAGMNAQQASDWRMNTTGFDSKFGVLYWPWMQMFDATTGKNATFPPSGHIAGLWSRNDDTRGVFKAPANEILLGAVGVDYPVTRGEMDMLNPQGVNSIKSFPGRGIRVWGARTLSSDAEWRYVNVRRYFNYLEESILQGTQWAVFEPNDANLWGRIRRTISAFLVNEWRSGALFGSSPAEAFFVKCDGENNTAESIDLGMVIVEVGVAPVKPAEFVIFRLSQFSGGTSIAE
jgi:phage tail sheath protein FI